MPATPKKGRRFGGSSQHQRLMMANLVASLVAAEGIVTTEAKAKALRPIAEKVITKAKKGGLHNHRQVVSYLGDKEMAAQALHRGRAPLRRPQRRLHADPEARQPSGRQRPDGAHRARLVVVARPRSEPAVRPAAALEGSCSARQAAPRGWGLRRSLCPHTPAGAPGYRPPCDPLRRATERPSRLRPRCGFGCSSPMTGRRSTGSPSRTGVATVAGTLRAAIEKVVRHPVELTCAGRTDRGVHAWGQVVSLDLAADGRPRRPAPVAAQAVRPRDRRAVESRSPPPTSTPGSPPPGAPTATRCSTARCPTRSSPPRPGTCTTPLDIELLTLACDPFIGEHDFSAFCRRPKGPSRSSLVRRVRARPGGPTSATACCASRSRPPRSATRWCAASSAPSWPPGTASVRAGDIRGILRSGDRANAAPIAPPRGPLPLAGRLLTTPRPGPPIGARVAVGRRPAVVLSFASGALAPGPLPRVPQGRSACARTAPRPARSPASGGSSMPRTSSSAASPPKPPASCAASTSPPSRRTWTWATTSS